MNRFGISGKIVELGALRFTPAGVAVVEFKLTHESEQEEAGGRRRVNVEMSAVAFEAQARLLAAAKVGSAVALEGFMSARSKRSKKPVLHVTGVEFVEGA